MKNDDVFLINAIGEKRESDNKRVAYFGHVLRRSEAEKVLDLIAQAPDGWGKEVHGILADKESWTLYAEKEQFKLDQMVTKEQIESVVRPGPKLTDAFFEVLYRVTERLTEQLRRNETVFKALHRVTEQLRQDKPKPVKSKV